MRWIGLALLFAFLMAGCVSVSRKTGGVSESRLGELLSERLLLADQVAWVKYRDRLPIEDPEREAAFLASVEVQALEYQLDPAFVRQFFEAQIRASKIEQRRKTRWWNQGNPLPDYGPLSLRGNVRPKIDQLTRELMKELASSPITPALRRDLYDYLRAQGWSWQVASAAVGF